ncbi:MAG: L-lysine 6-transaminase [Candidatus Glassbacteria bacterium]
MGETTANISQRIEPGLVKSTIGRYMLADGFDIIVDLQNSRGCRLVDAVTGDEYLDFFNFFASCPIGTNHPKLLEKETREKLIWAAINKPSNSDFYTTEMAEFVETFATQTLPPELPHLFFISGGALAVENAMKTAFDWKVRWNLKRGSKEERGFKVIHFEQCFHGRTGYTLSCTNTADPRKTKYFPTFDWPRIPNPKIEFPPNEENLRKVVEAEERSLSLIRKAIDQSPEDVAAIIIEPIQGEGGDNHFRGEFLRELKAIADRFEIFLIFDEIQTGFGATGKWWAFEHFDIVPDIIAFGKKTQVCGIAVGRKVDSIKNNVFEESSRINSTWGGNLADMMRCKYYIDIIVEENLLENAGRMGEYFVGRLEELSQSFRDTMRSVRGRGCMIAFDLPSDEIRQKLLAEMRKNKLLALACGKRSVRFRPPLNVSKEEVDESIDILYKSLKSI